MASTFFVDMVETDDVPSIARKLREINGHKDENLTEEEAFHAARTFVAGGRGSYSHLTRIVQEVKQQHRELIFSADVFNRLTREYPQLTTGEARTIASWERTAVGWSWSKVPAMVQQLIQERGLPGTSKSELVEQSFDLEDIVLVGNPEMPEWERELLAINEEDNKGEHKVETPQDREIFRLKSALFDAEMNLTHLREALERETEAYKKEIADLKQRSHDDWLASRDEQNATRAAEEDAEAYKKDIAELKDTNAELYKDFEQAARELTQLQVEKRERDEAWEKLTVRLHELFDEMNWCEEADDEAAKYGIRRRDQEFGFWVSLGDDYENTTVKMWVEVKAPSNEEAEKKLDQVTVVGMLRDRLGLLEIKSKT